MEDNSSSPPRGPVPVRETSKKMEKLELDSISNVSSKRNSVFTPSTPTLQSPVKPRMTLPSRDLIVSSSDKGLISTPSPSVNSRVNLLNATYSGPGTRRGSTDFYNGPVANNIVHNLAATIDGSPSRSDVPGLHSPGMFFSRNRELSPESSATASKIVSMEQSGQFTTGLGSLLPNTSTSESQNVLYSLDLTKPVQQAQNQGLQTPGVSTRKASISMSSSSSKPSQVRDQIVVTSSDVFRPSTTPSALIHRRFSTCDPSVNPVLNSLASPTPNSNSLFSPSVQSHRGSVTSLASFPSDCGDDSESPVISAKLIEATRRRHMSVPDATNTLSEDTGSKPHVRNPSSSETPLVVDSLKPLNRSGSVMLNTDVSPTNMGASSQRPALNISSTFRPTANIQSIASPVGTQTTLTQNSSSALLPKTPTSGTSATNVAGSLVWPPRTPTRGSISSNFPANNLALTSPSGPNGRSKSISQSSVSPLNLPNNTLNAVGISLASPMKRVTPTANASPMAKSSGSTPAAKQSSKSRLFEGNDDDEAFLEEEKAHEEFMRNVLRS